MAPTKYPAPPYDELYDLHVVKQYSRKALEHNYSVTGPVIDRWFREHNIEYMPSQDRRRPSYEELFDLHVNKRMTVQDLCQHYNRGQQYIKQWLEHYSMDHQKFRKRRKTSLSTDDLYDKLIKLHHIDKLTLKEISQVFEVSDVIVGVWFKNLGIEVIDNYHPSNVSKGETQLFDFICSLEPDAIRTRKVLDNKMQIDCYIPEKKLGFEYNGLYWHSEVHLPNSYHLYKLNNAESKNIRLIQILEDEWILKQDICKSMILNQLRRTPKVIYGRHTKCVIVESKQAKQFIEANHIQGKPNTITLAIGLIEETSGDLVAVMSFAPHHRSSSTNTIVLNRMCSKINTNVVGGASKLFKFALQHITAQTIVSWSDKRWSRGDVYKQLGFNHDGALPPDYWYIKGQVRYPKQRFQKRFTGCPPEVTEHDFMRQQNYLRLWDCGKDRWVYNIQQ